MSKKPRAGIISLGCARNLVDSEVILGSLKRSGYTIAEPEDGVDICVVNTCAFVKDARDESVEAVLEAAELKKSGRVKRLVICGCLPQLYKEKLAGHFSGADLIIGSGDFPLLPGLLKTLKPGGPSRPKVSARPSYLYDDRSPRFSLTPPHYAYLKISEGCSNLCSYCIISRLRGTLRSRSVRSILKEVGNISHSGALKELNLIGQDTTMFGSDRYGRPALDSLLHRICALKNGIEWVRLLYTHPAHYSDGLIGVIRDEPKICKYLDLPIQHISDRILKRMNRATTRKGISTLIERLRKCIPGLVLRTSIIVGFPGETDKDFGELLKFVEDTRFDRLGSFIYSKEDSTAASRMKEEVPEKVKQDRRDELMRTQRKISMRINKRYVGRTMKVLVDERLERDRFIGRTQGDAPDVDGAVYVSGKGIRTGEFCRARITGFAEYDLMGEKA